MRASKLLTNTGPLLIVFAIGCGGGDSPGRTFYERTIEPILIQTCASNTGGCHSANPDDPHAFAAGNLDVTSFENVQKRRDLLQTFGAYPVPMLLVKAVGTGGGLTIDYNRAGSTSELVPLEVVHTGGNILQVNSDAFTKLLDWMNNGATENGLPPPDPPRTGDGACSELVPDEFDDAPIRANPTFSQFKNDVQPVFEACASGTCHGAPAADFFVTCGTDDRQIAFNFTQVQAFVDEDIDNSQILLVPLAVSAGGYFHSGGEHFASRVDDGYEAIAEWAASPDVGAIEFGAGDPGKQFFADHIQPILLKRGCSFENCHSPGATNDLKLRSGSQGFISAIALEKNYELLRDDFLAVEVPDARRGRAVAKTIRSRDGGIEHRGGAVLGGADPAACPQPFDPATSSAFCAFQEWMRIEREALLGAGEVDPLTTQVPVVYVRRQESHVADLLEFDTFQPNSDLRVATAQIDASGRITQITGSQSLLTSCGVQAQNVDVRAPDVNRDGQTIAFAMRTSAGTPLQIYTVDIGGTNCQQITMTGAGVHNFDPAWAPDGEHIVFASTRGKPGVGPTLSRQRFLPQSDIWRMDRQGGGIEQVTFLTNSEIGPQFMREGRIIMTTEKVSEGFYQLSGRRINWDRTDYHPLLAQRAESPFAVVGDDVDPREEIAESVGYGQATEIREGFDGNFLLVFSEPGARAGTLGVFNRSVGTFEAGRTDDGFARSVVIPDPAATGRVGAQTDGAYRSPFPLPDGRILASYAPGNFDLGTVTSLPFGLVAVDPATGARSVLLDEPGVAEVEAVLAIRYPERNLFLNVRQLVFGGTSDIAQTGQDRAILHFPDAPLIFTLLNANLRRGRPVELFRPATQLAIYEEAPATGSNPNTGDIFQQRTLLGRAPLASDGSVRVNVPAGIGLILELQDANGNPIETMREEHQLGPGEITNFGIADELYDAVCGGCHGSISGRELDIAVTADALTGASESASAEAEPASVQ